jgi:hypothetical protein
MFVSFVCCWQKINKICIEETLFLLDPLPAEYNYCTVKRTNGKNHIIMCYKKKIAAEQKYCNCMKSKQLYVKYFIYVAKMN